MDKDEILRKAVSIGKKEPIGFDHKTTLENKRKLEEASGRLVDERLKKIEEKLEEFKPSPIREFVICTLAAVAGGLIVFAIQSVVDSNQEPQVHTETNTESDTNQENEKVLNSHRWQLL